VKIDTIEKRFMPQQSMRRQAGEYSDSDVAGGEPSEISQEKEERANHFQSSGKSASLAIEMTPPGAQIDEAPELRTRRTSYRETIRGALVTPISQFDREQADCCSRCIYSLRRTHKRGIWSHLEKILTPTTIIFFFIAFLFNVSYEFNKAVMFLYITCVCLFFATLSFLMNNKLYSKEELFAKVALPISAVFFACALTAYFFVQTTYYNAAIEQPVTITTTKRIRPSELGSLQYAVKVRISYDRGVFDPCAQANSSTVSKSVFIGDLKGFQITNNQELKWNDGYVCNTFSGSRWYYSQKMICESLGGIVDQDQDDFLDADLSHIQDEDFKFSIGNLQCYEPMSASLLWSEDTSCTYEVDESFLSENIGCIRQSGGVRLMCSDSSGVPYDNTAKQARSLVQVAMITPTQPLALGFSITRTTFTNPPRPFCSTCTKTMGLDDTNCFFRVSKRDMLEANTAYVASCTLPDGYYIVTCFSDEYDLQENRGYNGGFLTIEGVSLRLCEGEFHKGFPEMESITIFNNTVTIGHRFPWEGDRDNCQSAFESMLPAGVLEDIPLSFYKDQCELSTDDYGYDCVWSESASVCWEFAPSDDTCANNNCTGCVLLPSYKCNSELTSDQCKDAVGYWCGTPVGDRRRMSTCTTDNDAEVTCTSDESCQLPSEPPAGYIYEGNPVLDCCPGCTCSVDIAIVSGDVKCESAADAATPVTFECQESSSTYASISIPPTLIFHGCTSNSGFCDIYSGTEVEMQPLYEGSRCRSSKSNRTNRSLQECAEAVLSEGMRYFSFKGDDECRIANSDDGFTDYDACIDDKTSNANVADWNVYDACDRHYIEHQSTFLTLEACDQHIVACEESADFDTCALFGRMQCNQNEHCRAFSVRNDPGGSLYVWYSDTLDCITANAYTDPQWTFYIPTNEIATCYWPDAPGYAVNMGSPCTTSICTNSITFECNPGYRGFPSVSCLTTGPFQLSGCFLEGQCAEYLGGNCLKDGSCELQEEELLCTGDGGTWYGPKAYYYRFDGVGLITDSTDEKSKFLAACSAAFHPHAICRNVRNLPSDVIEFYGSDSNFMARMAIEFYGSDDTYVETVLQDNEMEISVDGTSLLLQSPKLMSRCEFYQCGEGCLHYDSSDNSYGCFPAVDNFQCQESCDDRSEEQIIQLPQIETPDFVNYILTDTTLTPLCAQNQQRRPEIQEHLVKTECYEKVEDTSFVCDGYEKLKDELFYDTVIVDFEFDNPKKFRCGLPKAFGDRKVAKCNDYELAVQFNFSTTGNYTIPYYMDLLSAPKNGITWDEGEQQFYPELSNQFQRDSIRFIDTFVKTVTFVQTVTLEKETDIHMKVHATTSYNTDPSIFRQSNMDEVMPRKVYMKFTFPVIRSGDDVWFEIQVEEESLTYSFNLLWTSFIATGGATISLFAMVFRNTLPRRYFRFGQDAFDFDVTQAQQSELEDLFGDIQSVKLEKEMKAVE